MAYNSNYTGAQVEGLLDKINGLPTPTASDCGKVLGVNNSGKYALITTVSVYSGTSEPSSTTGNDGDIYLQT